jgi:hypothetical protein
MNLRGFFVVKLTNQELKERFGWRMENQATSLEQTLVNIVRTLPPERVSELVDFARFLQALVIRTREAQEWKEVQDSEGDKKWDELLARAESQELLLEMAREARADYYAGRTTEIDITEDGRLAPK